MYMPKFLPLPIEVIEICRAVDAPPRLVAHLTLVHDVAGKFMESLRRMFPELEFDEEVISFGAATHDIGR